MERGNIKQQGPARRRVGISSFAAAIASLIVASVASAQSAPVIGSGPSVPDVEHCRDGQCAVIGKPKPKSYKRYPETHLFPAGEIPRKPNGKKAHPYYYDDIENAIDRVESGGIVFAHPGEHVFQSVELRGRPKSVTIKGAEPDIGVPILKPLSGRCFAIAPDYSDDPVLANAKIRFEAIVIAPLPGQKGDVCIDSSRLTLEMQSVRMLMGAHAGTAIKIHNKVATIGDTEISTTTLASAIDQSAFSFERSSDSVGIDVSGYASMKLSGRGATGLTLAGFDTAIKAAGPVEINDAAIADVVSGIRLLRSNTLGVKQTEKLSSIKNSFVALSGELDGADGRKAIGVDIPQDYDGDVLLDGFFVDGPLPLFGTKGVGVSSGAGAYVTEIKGGAFTRLDAGLSLSADANIEGVRFTDNEAALSLSFSNNQAYIVNGVNFLANRRSFSFSDVAGGYLELSAIDYDDVKNGKNGVSAPELPRELHYAVECVAERSDRKSYRLYRMINAEKVCGIRRP